VSKYLNAIETIIVFKKMNDHVSSERCYYRPIEAKCVASVTNCGLGLETTMASTVNKERQLFINDKYWESFSKLVHITRKLRLVFQLNDCIFRKDLTQYLSGYNPMSGRTDIFRWMIQLSNSYSCWLAGDFLAWVSMD